MLSFTRCIGSQTVKDYFLHSSIQAQRFSAPHCFYWTNHRSKNCAPVRLLSDSMPVTRSCVIPPVGCYYAILNGVKLALLSFVKSSRRAIQTPQTGKL